MAEIQNQIIDHVKHFYESIRELYPVKKIFLYGSHVKGCADEDSDIDVGVVIDWPDHRQRPEITSQLFRYARKINHAIEPKCIFWDEFQNREPASILNEIIQTGITIV